MAESPLAMAARMLVSGLGPGRKDALLALLCKDDPGKVVMLYALLDQQPQVPIPVAEIAAYPTRQTPSAADVEARQPVKRARLGSNSIMPPTPAASNAHFRSCTPGLAQPPDAETGEDVDVEVGDASYKDDQVEEDEGVEEKDGAEEEDDAEDKTERFQESEEHQQGCKRSPKPPKRIRTQLYEEFNWRTKGRCDRLLAYDTEYRRFGRSCLKKDFSAWVVQRERQAVEAGILSNDGGITFKTWGAVLDFLDNYGYGCRAQHAQLARWHDKAHPGMPNPNRGYDLPATEPRLMDPADKETITRTSSSLTNTTIITPTTAPSQPIPIWIADPVNFPSGLSLTALEISDGYAACQSLEKKKQYLRDVEEDCASILRRISIACALPIPKSRIARGDVRVRSREVNLQTVLNALESVLDVGLSLSFATPISLSTDLKWTFFHIQTVSESLVKQLHLCEERVQADQLGVINGKMRRLKAVSPPLSGKLIWAEGMMTALDQLSTVKERIA